MTILTGAPDVTVMAFGLNTIWPCVLTMIRETVAVVVLVVCVTLVGWVRAWAPAEPKTRKESAASARIVLNTHIGTVRWIRFVVM